MKKPKEDQSNEKCPKCDIFLVFKPLRKVFYGRRINGYDKKYLECKICGYRKQRK